MERLVYFNGKMVPEKEVKISVFDIGFMYGATFMEAVRTFNHEYFKLYEHLERLDKTFRYVGLGSLVSKKKMEDIFNMVLEKNIHLTDKDDDCWVCANVTPGVGFPHPLMKQKDLTPTIVVYSVRLPHNEYVKYYTEGRPAVIPIIRNIPPQCMDPRCKTRSRLHYFIAKREALERDPESFALLLDINGNLTESSGSNFFIASNGILYTSTPHNILNGISRQIVIELASELNIPVHERDLSLYDAYNADEAFFTTTSYCILPISKINNIKVGKQIPGDLTKKLLDLWSKKVGVDIVGQAQKFARFE
jgi:branched-chain amino acid aminotransferase